jgi:hypothetical protein
MNSGTYRLHGWNVRSPVPLGHQASHTEVPDIRISLDEASALVRPTDALQGALIAGIRGDRPFYELIEVGERQFVLRFHGLVDLHISLGPMIEVIGRWHAGADRARLQVMLSGTLMAALLMLIGRTVLHASAIRRDGRTVAMVGQSGAGKSTLAAMCCRRGAQLVTDDVLDTWVDGDRAFAHRGGRSLRLREGSKGLADRRGDFDESSADGRLLWAPEATPSDVVPIDAILFPRLQAGDATLRVEAVSRKSALLALLGTPRILGWNDAPTAAVQLDGLASLVMQVPTASLEIPWGTDMSEHALRRVTDAILGWTA